MILLCSVLLVMASVAQCHDFLDNPPANYNIGNSFKDCQKRFPDVEQYVYPQAVGGIRVYSGEFQHMAAIGWSREDGNIDYLCGGSLITWQFILTAAHCAVDSNNLPPDTVRLGDTDLGSTDEDTSAQQVAIGRIIKHPQHRESRKYYDIALIELVKRVWPSDAICTACIWREANAPSVRMDAVGFGALGFGEKLSPTLQKVQLDELSLADCAKRVPMNRRQMPDGLRADQLCASGDTMDTCEGDSGGPIQTERYDLFGNVFPLLVGVVSFGTPCIEGSTGVYTRVSSYIDWIEKEVNQSLSYDVCTTVNGCNRKFNPASTATVHSGFPRNRYGLLWSKDEQNVFQCGGLLIDYQFILTSADCVTSDRGYPTFVASHMTSDRVPVEDVYVHPQFVPGKPSFDIALIKLSKYANLDETLPVCPWTGQANDVSAPLFGVSVTQSRSYVEDFDNSTKSYLLPRLFGDRCTVSNDGVANDLECISRNLSLVPAYCQVDYGGPVLTKLYDDAYRVRGVLSRLTKDCGSNIIYTKITPHIEWMESIMFKQLHQHLIFSD